MQKQERRGSWVQNIGQRFGSPRAGSQRKLRIPAGEQTPLLPLTMPPLPQGSSSGGSGGGDTTTMSATKTAVSNTADSESPLSPGASNITKQQQPQQQHLSAPSASESTTLTTTANTGSKESRKGVISSGRKIIGRPLRAVGRAVSRGKNRSANTVDEDDEEADLMGEDIVNNLSDAELSATEHGGGHNRSSSSNGEMIMVRSSFRSSASSSPRDGSNNAIVSGGGGGPGMIMMNEHSDDSAVHYIEQTIRQILLLLAAYIVGAKFPNWVSYASKATEYAITAWITCVVILCLAYCQRKGFIRIPKRRGRRNKQQQRGLSETANERMPLLASSSSTSRLEKGGENLIAARTPVVASDQNGVEVSYSSPDRSAPEIPVLKLPNDQKQPQSLDYDTGRSRVIDDSSFDQNVHPSLNCYYLMDTFTGKRIYPNTIGKPTHLSNEWFELDMLVLVRTPDVDDSSVKSYPNNEKALKYFRGKQRHFEFQYQMKMKKAPPPGVQVMFACELDEQIKIGMIQKAFVGAAMAFIKTTNPTFHYSITGSKDKNNDGTYEKPHMAFTVEGSLDRLVVTKPGEHPPELGTVIHEDPESVKRRKKGITVDWNTEDIYTMALWTSYVDFIDWKVLNLPGIRPFGLSSVLGTQPFYMNMYIIKENRGNDKHYEKDKEKIVNLELSNDAQALLGPSAKTWYTSNQAKIKQLRNQKHKALKLCEDMSLANGETAVPLHDDNDQDLRPTASAEDLMGDLDDDADDDEETAAELGEGIYMRSGDTVILREFIELDAEENQPTFSLSSGGGFAVLQERDCTIIVEKARKSKRNRLIKSGDVVMFKMIQKKGEKDTETRYLTIHRGWWLKWVSNAPSKNGYFTIESHDAECVRSDETQTSFLTMGGTFTLRHKRWSSYHVGVSADPSATYGGRMLGLYNPKKNAHLAGSTSNASSDDHYQSDEGEMGLDDDLPDAEDNKGKIGWMKPLILSAHDPNSLTLASASPKANLLPNEVGGDVEDGATPDSPSGYNPMSPTFLFSPKHALKFSNEHASADVPAWIEMMNRTDRVRQLTYVVRVIQREPVQQLRSSPSADEDEQDDSSEAAEKDPETFVRLRTGREVARIMQVGQSKSNYYPQTPNGNKKSRGGLPSSNSFKGDPRSQAGELFRSGDGMRTPTSDRKERLLALSPSRSHSADDLMLPIGDDEESDDDSIGSDEEDMSVEELAVEDIEPLSSEDEAGFSEPESVPESILESDSELELSHRIERTERKHGAVHKGKSLIGKVAKATGKTAAKTIVGSGKLTAKTIKGTGKLTAKTVKGTGKLTKKTVVGTGKLTVKTAKGTGKVAVGAGKAAMKGSKKVAKGTVRAGKAVTVGAGKAVVAPISRKGNKPPKAEPKKRGRDKQEKKIGVSKTMKKLGKIEAKSDSKSAHTENFLAGELCAPEQSCRTASKILQRMSSVPFMSPAWKTFNDALCSQVAEEADQDRWFLDGNSVHVGVTPLSGNKSRGPLLHESLVARCLWESHWREEWCGMYPSCLSFYSPLTKSPCLEIAYIDITNVRPLDSGYLSPLPGFPLLVLETAWLCHYIAFKDEEARDTFGEKVEDAIENHIREGKLTSLRFVLLFTQESCQR